jgi:hypothetical protein
MNSALLPIYELYVMVKHPRAARAAGAMARKVDQAISLIAADADRAGVMRSSVSGPVVRGMEHHHRTDPTTAKKQLIRVGC